MLKGWALFMKKFRLIPRLSLLPLLILAGPLLFAIGPVGAPPPSSERVITYYTCASGTSQYTGFEHWYFCEYNSAGYGGNTGTNYAWVEDSTCEGSATSTYYCKRSNGTWKVISQADFASCATCT